MSPEFFDTSHATDLATISTLQVRFKKLTPEAVTPTYAKHGDAGLDLTVTKVEQLYFNKVKYHFGIAIEIPDGYVGLLFPRSSIHKTPLSLTNSVGVIDSGYRGEIMAVMHQHSNRTGDLYKQGDKAVQLIIIPYPRIQLHEVTELTSTERGTGGYGSTGK